MSMSRWLPVAIFLIAIAAAWQLAKPSPSPEPQSFSPAGNAADSVNTRQMMPQRAIGSPPPPVKISEDVGF